MELRDMLNVVLDIILPRRARSVRTEARSLEDIPTSPTEHESLGEFITTLMEYRERPVEDLIRALKYDGSAHATELCAEILADYLTEEIVSLRTFSNREILLVPVPLHGSRKRERGFNQIELVLQKLPKEFKDGTLARISLNSLTRTRATPQQTHLSKTERIKNAAGAFEVPTGHDLSKTHVFLIDDVTTTGATLSEASRPLRESGATVSAIAFARA